MRGEAEIGGEKKAGRVEEKCLNLGGRDRGSEGTTERLGV